MIRAFLAVELSQELRAGLTTVQQELKRKIETGMTRNTRISWVQPTSIHLTIKFLGDMDEQALDALLVAVEHAIGNQPAVNVPLDRLGAFPRPQSPRVLWVGPPENWEQGRDAKGIGEIHGAIEAACEGLGFLRETKPFSLHLTLARIRMGERHVGLALTQSGVLDRPISAGSLAVESVALMRSELKPTGSVHTKLWEVRLQG
ncbi:MAG TPA: RNA 2',3'-cyclic phosphodiesterase [Nitrospiraceae bacterium]|nr:RNA 2',3'-cyclic phosphodiesterase [Nitrospiraceae bacterium]